MDSKQLSQLQSKKIIKLTLVIPSSKESTIGEDDFYLEFIRDRYPDEKGLDFAYALAT
jgi:hypothetical protein